MEKEERKSNNFRVVKKECFWWTESNITAPGNNKFGLV